MYTLKEQGHLKKTRYCSRLLLLLISLCFILVHIYGFMTFLLHLFVLLRICCELFCLCGIYISCVQNLIILLLVKCAHALEEYMSLKKCRKQKMGALKDDKYRTSLLCDASTSEIPRNGISFTMIWRADKVSGR